MAWNLATHDYYQPASTSTRYRSANWPFWQAHEASSQAPSLGRPFFNPLNVHFTTTIAPQNALLDYMNQFVPLQDIALRVQWDFFTHRGRFGPFSVSNASWKFEDPLTFWYGQQGFTPELANIAIRLFRTPASSVPSEWSFSGQNLIHSKFRNRLHPTWVYKLTFLYINRRVLDRKPMEKYQWQQLSREDELELEDKALDLGPDQPEEFGQVEAIPGILSAYLYRAIIWLTIKKTGTLDAQVLPALYRSSC